jgi:hypothetical protein
MALRAVLRAAVAEVFMTARLASLLLVIALFAAPAIAKKKAPTLPEDILRARTVLVVIDPDAGEPIDNPRVNETARDSVEKALMQWGRFNVVMDGARADLLIVVRTGDGRMGRPTMKGGPIDNRPGVAQSGDGATRIGVQRGTPPPLTDPATDPQAGPHVSNEIGPSDDSFAVYRGGSDHPLDSSAVWRYVAKDCLREPNVAAVDEFRKAIAASEKPQAPAPKGP